MLTVFCPKCYAQNRFEDKLCRVCGAKLDEERGDYVERLISFSLHHPVPSVPPMAAETLGKIGDKRAVEPLMEVLNTSEEPGLLEAAAEALGKLKDERAVSALFSFMQRGTVAARLKAVDALAEIGGNQAIAALEEVTANDPSTSVREEAKRTLDRLRGKAGRCDGSKSDGALAGIGEAHKRGISITLTILDETLCEVEQWANGREIQSVFYREHNTLSKSQRQKMLSQIAQMRAILRELQEALGLEPGLEDVRSAIRGKCAGLWEHIVELKAQYLRRYGDVPEELGEYVDPRAEQLIQGILHILDALKTGT